MQACRAPGAEVDTTRSTQRSFQESVMPLIEEAIDGIAGLPRSLIS